MKKFLLTAIALSGMSLFAFAAKAESIHGVLIDNACGAKQADEAAAAKHPLGCAKKEACEASGYQVIVGDKHYKLNDAGNAKAKAYLAEAKTTHVIVDGKIDGDKLEVTAIAAGSDSKKKE